MHNVHSLLDYLVVETVVSNRPMGKRMRIPYRNVLPDDKLSYPDAELVVEIFTYWDGESHGSEQDSDNGDSADDSEPNPTSERN